MSSKSTKSLTWDTQNFYFHLSKSLGNLDKYEPARLTLEVYMIPNIIVPGLDLTGES